MKECYADICDDTEVDEVISKGIDIICNNPDSIEPFKNADKDHIKYFLKSVVKGEQEDYFLVVFKDLKDHHLVGTCLFSSGSPWYNPNIIAVNEECTVAFEKGYGIARAVAEELEFLLTIGFDIVQASSANECVAKLIENTYNKYGFKQYKTYYKTK